MVLKRSYCIKQKVFENNDIYFDKFRKLVKCFHLNDIVIGFKREIIYTKLSEIKV